MRKIISILLMLTMLFTLVACSTTENVVVEKTNPIESQEQVSGDFVNVETEKTSEKLEVKEEASEIVEVKEVTYKITTTGQLESYDEDGNIITPSEGESFYGQDADYDSLDFNFTDNDDGTVTDNVTGLTWQQIPISQNMSWEEAIEYCENLELGGYDDWRIPTAKELFGISDFSQGWPFIDEEYFEFAEDTLTTDEEVDGSPQGNGGAPQDGSTIENNDSAVEGENSVEGENPPPPAEEETDDGSASKSEGQYWSANFYEVGTTHGDAPSAFGVNHVTGHIKAYPSEAGGAMGKYVRAVRGEETAINDYVDNGDGTITDEATGLMWMSSDNGEGVEWEDALAYAENFEFAGYDDWRLPDVKELQSIVDYSGNYPAIDDDFFETTELEENINYYFWTSTSAYFSTELPENGFAWYVAFGKAVGDDGEDSHGAGAVRFSPKYVDSEFVGEGGDNMLNSVRLVRNTN